MSENMQKVKVRGKKNSNCSTKQKKSKAVGGQETRGRIAQEWYENDGKQNDLLSKTHQTLVTYTEKEKGEKERPGKNWHQRYIKNSVVPFFFFFFLPLFSTSFTMF